MDRGLVNFEYRKLCFTIGGEATDAKPNKVYQSVRVCTTHFKTFTF